jgi:hypothetical protein
MVRLGAVPRRTESAMQQNPYELQCSNGGVPQILVHMGGLASKREQTSVKQSWGELKQAHSRTQHESPQLRPPRQTSKSASQQGPGQNVRRIVHAEINPRQTADHDRVRILGQVPPSG